MTTRSAPKEGRGDENELLAWALVKGPTRRVNRYLRARQGKRKDKHRARLLAWARENWSAAG